MQLFQAMHTTLTQQLKTTADSLAIGSTTTQSQPSSSQATIPMALSCPNNFQATRGVLCNLTAPQALPLVLCQAYGMLPNGGQGVNRAQRVTSIMLGQYLCLRMRQSIMKEIERRIQILYLKDICSSIRARVEHQCNASEMQKGG
jgi:hypothetical protein